MITPDQAMALPAAQLTESEKQIITRILDKIDAHIRASMKHCGVELNISCTIGNVIAEVDAALKRAGWVPTWIQMQEESKIQGAPPTHRGYTLSLAPPNELLNFIPAPASAN